LRPTDCMTCVWCCHCLCYVDDDRVDGQSDVSPRSTSPLDGDLTTHQSSKCTPTTDHQSSAGMRRCLFYTSTHNLFTLSLPGTCSLLLYLITKCNEGKVLPCLLPSVGPGADPGVQAVRPQVTLSHPLQTVGCHYFSPGLQSPSQPNITVLWPVPSYAAWWQKHIGVKNLPKVDTQLYPSENWTHDLMIASPMLYW